MTHGSDPTCKRHPRTFTLLTAAAVAVAGLGACSGDPGGGDEETVKLTLWDTDARTARTERLTTLIDMFEDEHPGIEVEYVGLPTDSYMEKIETAIATDSTPDLLTPKASDLSALVAQQALTPLDERMAADGFDETMSASMIQSARSAVADGKLYLTPSTALTDVIWYRPDLFDDAGLGTPETWSDFYEAADTLTVKDSGQFGYTIRGGSGYWSQFVGMVLPEAGVGTYFNEDGTSVFRNPEVVAAAESYAGLYGRTTAQSDLTADFKVMVAQFAAGSTAMLSHSIGSYPDHVAALGEDKVAAAVAFPADNGVRVQSSLVLGFAMFEGTEHPDEAWEFLKFMMEEEGNAYWARESGYIPGNDAVAAESWVADSQPIAVSQEAMADPATIPLEHPYYLPEFTAITTVDSLPQWQKTLQGDLSVEDFCAQIADAFEASYDGFQARATN